MPCVSKMHFILREYTKIVLSIATREHLKCQLHAIDNRSDLFMYQVHTLGCSCIFRGPHV